MADVIKNEREFVVPGDEIVNSMEYLPGRNSFRDGNSIFSKRIGLVHIENRVVSIVPLSGSYTAQIGDMVIGEVIDIQSNGWIVNIDSGTDAYLPLAGIRQFIRQGSDLSKVYGIGDILYAKISIASGNSLNISLQDIRARKLVGGKLLTISAVKVPRLIGKQGSMISLIKDRTGCNIYAGQNGIIWVFGDNYDLVTEVLRKIEKESHVEGLTDSIEKLLLEKGIKKAEVKSSEPKEESQEGFNPEATDSEDTNEELQ